MDLLQFKRLKNLGLKGNFSDESLIGVLLSVNLLHIY